MSAYAIRFLPIDPRDVSPALYMSTQRGCRLTSLPAGDVETGSFEDAPVEAQEVEHG